MGKQKVWVQKILGKLGLTHRPFESITLPSYDPEHKTMTATFRNKRTFFPYCISLNYVQPCSIIAMYTGLKTRDTTTTTTTTTGYTNERFAAHANQKELINIYLKTLFPARLQEKLK